MTPNRLSAADLTNLALEAPDTLMHQAAFGVLEGSELLGPDGRVRIDAVRERLAPKVARIPELRHVLRMTGLLQGRPLWVDDPSFRIENHVRASSLPTPGGESEAAKFVERLMAVQMDRSRPLWELWFLDGIGPGRIGIVAKTHHALVDGLAMINLLAQLFDFEPESHDAPGVQWSPLAPPSAPALIADNITSHARSVARAVHGIRHPLQLALSAGESIRGAWETVRQGLGAPRTSLNHPIGIGRRFGSFRLDLRDVKLLAHSAGAKVNDVFLALVAGALRSVLLARGENTTGTTLHASIAVSMHAPGDGALEGNRVGTMLVPLPLAEADARARLAAIAAATALAKAKQRPVVTPTFMSVLARFGLMRRYIRRQRMINVLTTNLPGPPSPMYVAGAQLLEVFAVPPIAGNVTLSLAAISYEGQFNVSAFADSAAWPDLDVLIEGLGSSWRELAECLPQVPLAAGL